MIPFKLEVSHAKQLHDDAKAAVAAISDEKLARICAFNPLLWTRPVVHYVHDQYVAGKSSYAIGDEIGVSSQAVLRALRILEVPIRRSGPPSSLSDEQKAQVAQLLKKFNQREVIEMLGVSRNAVQVIAATERRNAQV